MAEPFDSAQDLNSRFLRTFLESSVVPGQPVLAISGPGGASVPVSISGSVTVLTPGSGEVNVGIGPTPSPLGGMPNQFDEVTVTAKITNTSNILLGDSGVQLYQMEPGREIVLHNVDLSTIFIFGVAGEGVTYFDLT